MVRPTFSFDESERNIYTFDVYCLRASAAILPFDHEKNIYLLNEFAPGIGKWQLTLARGGIDKGEEPVDCARRECIEEMGVSCATVEPLWSGYMAASASNWHVSVFVGRGITSVPCVGGDEVYPMDVVKMPLADAVGKVVSGEIENALAALAIMMIAQKYKDRF